MLKQRVENVKGAKQTEALSTIALPKNQPKSVAKKIVIQRLIFGFRLHDAPNTGDMDENNPKHWNSQLLVVPDVFHFNLHVDFAS